jgi:prophage regulatory protein
MRVLDLSDLKAKGIKYTRVHIARLERAKKFPKHINLGRNRTAWIEEEVDEWLREKAAERDNSEAPRPRGKQAAKSQQAVKPEVVATPGNTDPIVGSREPAEQAAASSPSPET